MAITDVPLKDVVEVRRRYGGLQVTFDLRRVELACGSIGVTLRQTATPWGRLSMPARSADWRRSSRETSVVTRPSGERGLGAVRYTVDDLAQPGGAGCRSSVP